MNIQAHDDGADFTVTEKLLKDGDLLYEKDAMGQRGAREKSKNVDSDFNNEKDVSMVEKTATENLRMDS